MIIIQKNYSGGNGRGTLEYHLNNTEGTEQHSPAIDYSSPPVRDPYKDKEDYLSTHFGEEKVQEVTEEEPGIVLKPGQKDPRKLDLTPAGLPKAKSRARVPKKIEDPVVLDHAQTSFSPEAIIQGAEIPEENKAGLSGAAKAGLIGAGVAALGAGSYAAYKAIKRKKAKKAAVDAEVDAFLENKYKTKKENK